MSKKISVGAAIMLMAITAAVAVTITMIYSMHLFNNNLTDFSTREAIFKKLSDVDATVRAQYIGKIDQTTLTDDIIRGYIAGTGDKHGNYFDADTYKQIKMNYEGNSIGIGVNVTKDDQGYIKVLSVEKGSPADQAGVKSDDLIIKVGADEVAKIGYDKAVEQLRGKDGTKAEFTVNRSGKQMPFTVVRKQFVTQSVESKLMNGIGYVRIIEFNENTDEQFSSAVDSLIAAGAKGLIFDVRNDPGGLLESVENMLDKLLPEGPIVSATYKNGKTEVLRKSDKNEIDLPMAVITNANTASAAELFTSALKDYGKAKSVGVKTYGKGTMQKTFPLNDGSALSISIAYFNPPKSPNFDGVGVEPDIPVELSQDKLNRFYELTPEEDDQLQAAVKYIDTQIK